MIRYRVRKVIELRDSVTGGTVTASGVRIFTSGALKRLDKGDGLVVLTDDGSYDAGEEIRIAGAVYLEETCIVPEYTPGSAQVHTIWLLPAPGYPVPVGIAAVNGTAVPGTRIDVTDMAHRESLKLTQDYEPSRPTVRLYHERGIAPMGRWYRAVCKESSCECFIGEAVSRAGDYTEYQMRVCTGSGTLAAADTTFYPMTRTYADAKGEYIAALPFVTAADTQLSIAWTHTQSSDTGADTGTVSTAGTKAGADTAANASAGTGRGGGAKRGKGKTDSSSNEGKAAMITISPGERLRVDEEDS